MSMCPLRAWLLCGFLSLAGTLMPGLARAQEAYAPPPSYASQLGNPRLSVAASLPPLDIDPDELELSLRSKRGPATELIFGSVILVWTPIVAIFVDLAAGPEWFACDSFLGDEPVDNQDECEARVARQEQSAMRKAVAVGMLQGSIGLGLMGHGIYRILRIRRARRHIELGSAHFSLSPGGGATLGLSASF
jgi:hypothetical protein